MRRVVLVVLASLSIAVSVAAQGPAGQTGSSNQPQETIGVAPYFEASTLWARLRTALDTIAGWPVAVPLQSYRGETFADAVLKASALRLAVVEGSSSQEVSAQIRKPLDYRLTSQDVQAVVTQLKTAGLQLRVYAIPALGPDDETTRKQFEFARALGATILAVGRVPDALPRVEALANEFGVNVAIGGQPEVVAVALQGRSPRIGVYADIGRWMDHGIRPLDGLALVSHRLLAIRLSDRNAGGRLGTGSAGIAELLEELRRSKATPTIVVDGSGAADAAADLSRAVADFEEVVRPAAAKRVAEVARAVPIRGPDRLRPAEREQITAAIPKEPAATPKKRRRLLVFDANIGYGGNTGGHRSISAATLVIDRFGRDTGAYEAVFSNDLENFKYDTLKQFDAVFLNNTVGTIFVDQEIRDSLIRFVREGGGLAGYHGVSHVSMDWPEFRHMLGAVEGAHKTANEIATVRIDDPTSPLTAAFEGRSFVHSDEFYRFSDGLLSRDRVRVLMSIDVANTDMNQPGDCSRCVRSDNDYILSWIRRYGQGRVFYTALGHNPSFFADEKINRFFLAGIQFALGDLEADTTPNTNVGATGAR